MVLPYTSRADLEDERDGYSTLSLFQGPIVATIILSTPKSECGVTALLQDWKYFLTGKKGKNGEITFTSCDFVMPSDHLTPEENVLLLELMYHPEKCKEKDDEKSVKENEKSVEENGEEKMEESGGKKAEDTEENSSGENGEEKVEESGGKKAEDTEENSSGENGEEKVEESGGKKAEDTEENSSGENVLPSSERD
ncbi:hypothetical protein ANCDUO_12464 [Ancylostoma duodenale]|uniref:Uncharacterized protein n=1 Tax=Ancylostoma duodenale TaxID=51022 RepID=A0A0C2GJX5_9BILA|nr:hypothetical protein ANCDUO_12464 [Ancylostoma duodenale]